MTLLNFNDPCNHDEHLEFNGVKSYDSWLDLALEEEDNIRIAVDALKEEYKIDTTAHALVEEDISNIMAVTESPRMANSILDEKKGIFMMDERYDTFRVLSFSCKPDYD